MARKTRAASIPTTNRTRRRAKAYPAYILSGGDRLIHINNLPDARKHFRGIVYPLTPYVGTLRMKPVKAP